LFAVVVVVGQVENNTEPRIEKNKNKKNVNYLIIILELNYNIVFKRICYLFLYKNCTLYFFLGFKNVLKLSVVIVPLINKVVFKDKFLSNIIKNKS
jgi:hypothetical protein